MHSRSILLFLARGVVGVSVIVAFLAIMDGLAWFQAPQDLNSHIEKRWSSLRKLHEAGEPVDVLILGDSHTYTGVNPKHLSAELGQTCMVLANNSMSWTDHYWTLREALEWCTPQTVVIETYGLDGNAPGSRSSAQLVNQIRVFEARKSPSLKYPAAWDLFTLDELAMGLSPTVRNHHFLWDSLELIGANMKHKGPRPLAEAEGLYLGRFIRFTTGLTNDTQARYDSAGPPVHGADLPIHPRNIEAARDIAALCKEHGITLIWLALPMYHRHVDGKEVWMQRVDSIRREVDEAIPFLELMTDSSLNARQEFFEDTYDANQHMTWQGSVMVSHRLAQFMDSLRGPEGINRFADTNWHRLMRESEGFYGFNAPLLPDSNVSVIFQNVRLKELEVKDVMRYHDPMLRKGMDYLQFRIHRWPDHLPQPETVQLIGSWEVLWPDKGRVRSPAVMEFIPHLSSRELTVFRCAISEQLELKRLSDLRLNLKQAKRAG